jgi:predicted nucleic acid-binding protein
MSGGKPVVSNSSPLIWLAKIGRLKILRGLFGEIVIPMRVYEESALRKRSADAVLIGRAVEEGWIKVSEERMGEADVLAGVSGIHLGEAEAILLAQKLDTELILDEREASATAQMFGVRPIGTIAVLLLALAKDRLTLQEFRECLDGLLASGFWLKVDVYNEALEAARSIAKRKN